MDSTFHLEQDTRMSKKAHESFTRWLTAQVLNPALNRLRGISVFYVFQRFVEQHISGRRIRFQDNFPRQVTVLDQTHVDTDKRSYLEHSPRLLMPAFSSSIRPRSPNSIKIHPRSPLEMQSFQNDV